MTDKKKTKTMVSVLFMQLSIVFTVCLIASNILETKQMVFGPLHLTGGLLIFPISYIVNDVVCEVWGYRRAGILIWTGFLTNFFFMAIASLADAIPGAPYWDNEAGFHAIFGLTPRIALASFVSFIAGSFVNAYVMSRMKIADHGKRFPLRAIMSTVWGEGADSVIFFPLAFYGVLPNEELPLMMLSQLVLKTVYEIIVLPVTVRVVKWVKKYEGEDAYDTGISYNIFAVFKRRE
ncbi:MAG: queuosine precursor transporter [Prevotella sp.]|nr:queuosine precursor transporter [Prevotella sp.]